MTNPDVFIAGAGATGLACAFALHKRGVRVALADSAPVPGGALRTVRPGGYLCEAGPNTLLAARDEVFALLSQAGLLESALDAAPDAKKRFVVKNGAVLPLPSSPPALLKTPLLSLPAKLRMLLEPFQPRGADPAETVAEFFTRRLGPEPVREFLDPFISGIYAGDPARLVTRFTMPRLREMEQRHGSLLLGMLRSKRGPKKRLLSWPAGLAELPAALAKPLPDVRLSTRVEAVRASPGGGFEIRLGAGTASARNVVLALPAVEIARLTGAMGCHTAAIGQIPHAPVAVLHLGFRRADVAHPLDGFGVLISRDRGLRTLGALFSSTLFPGRAPEGCVLLTVFLGGRGDPQALGLSEDDLVMAAGADLGPLLGLRAPPVFRHVVRWPGAIPQYEARHGRALAEAQAIERAHPGLHLAGSWRGGISIGDCLANGVALAGHIL